MWEWLGCPPPTHKDTPFPFPGHTDVETLRVSDSSATFDCIPCSLALGTRRVWEMKLDKRNVRGERWPEGVAKNYLSLSHFLDKRPGAVWLRPQISPWRSKR